MTPEEIDFFKWYASAIREIITIDAITTPKHDKVYWVLFFVLGYAIANMVTLVIT